jgi:putative transposase
LSSSSSSFGALFAFPVAVPHGQQLLLAGEIGPDELLGMLKGKTAIKLFKSYPALKRKPYWGNHFWSRGYWVSTVGLDEEKIRRYVSYQEERERQEESEQQEFGLL